MDTLQTTLAAKVTGAERLEGGVIRVYMRANGRQFRRLYEPGLPAVWMEGMYMTTPKQQIDLEKIFWALKPQDKDKEIINALPPPAPAKKAEPEMPERFVRTLTPTTTKNGAPDKPRVRDRDLDPSEQQSRNQKIIKYLAGGLNNEETASIVGIHRRTLEGLLFGIRQTYKARNTAHLIRLAVERRAIYLTPSADPHYNLTDRDREIIGHISNGLTAKEIGEHMSLTDREVLRLIADIRAECQAENWPHLVAIAISDKIIE